MSQKVEIPAIRDRDLRNVLEAFGLAEKINNRELLCESCSEVLTWDNIGVLFIKDEAIVLCCSLSECLDELIKGSE